MTDTTALAVQRSPEYLIDDILPSGEVHLLGGPSGGGKTTWLFQMLMDWSAGRPIFGKASHPVPYIYISTDRSKRGVKRTLKRMGLREDAIPFVSTITDDLGNIEAIINLFIEKRPEIRLLVIEGLTGLLPPTTGKGSDGGFTHVRRFLTHLSHLCEKYDITILGIVHSPKAKEDSQYLRARDRVMGSSAWSAYTETIILIEPVDANAPSVRRLMLLPRNSAEEHYDLQFNAAGRLVPLTDELDDVFVNLFLDKVPPPLEFSTEQFTHALRDNMSQSTITRKLKDLVKEGLVKKVRHGIYSRPLPA